MPQPVDYVKDPLLTRIAKGFSNADFIANTIFPRIDVEKERGSYYVFDKTNYRVEKDLRAGISRANRVDYGLTLADYGPLLERALEQGITDQEKRLMGGDEARRRATLNVMQKIQLRHESTVATLMADTAIITQNVTLSGTAQWNDYTNSVPFSDIATAVDTIQGTGINSPSKTVLVLGYQVYSKLRNHTALINRLGNASDKSPLTNAQLAALFDVDEVIVGKSMIDSAKEGQTVSLGYVWGKNAWVMKLAANPSIDQVNPGYTLQIPEERYVDRWDDRSVKAEFVRANDQFEAKLVAAEAVYLIKNAIA